MSSVGSDFFVVWSDSQRIRGARVSDSGAVKDSGGFLIGEPARATQLNPAVGSNGTGYLVAWREVLNGIYSARVTVDGTVLDTGGLLLTPSIAADLPDIASDGRDYLIVWQDGRDPRLTGVDILAARLTGQGQLLDANPIAVCTIPGAQSLPAVAFASNAYLVVRITS